MPTPSISTTSTQDLTDSTPKTPNQPMQIKKASNISERLATAMQKSRQTPPSSPQTLVKRLRNAVNFRTTAEAKEHLKKLRFSMGLGYNNDGLLVMAIKPHDAIAESKHSYKKIDEEIKNILIKLQNRDDTSELKIFSKYKPEVIDQAVKNNGYKINIEGAFYRKDISGAFRGAIQCPQELVEHGGMYAFDAGHTERHTTGITLCASSCYQDSFEYGRKNLGGAGQFHYGQQGDKKYYPFDSNARFDPNNVNDCKALRRKQTDGFVDLIDTRGMEVVRMIDNRLLNPHVSVTGGFTIPNEMHISVPEHEIIASDRIWLVSSNGKQAIKIDVLYEDFEKALLYVGSSVLGGSKTDIYDYLFAEATEKGLTVIDISKITEENAKQNIRNYQHLDYCSSNEAFLSQPVNEPYSSSSESLGSPSPD